MDLQTAKEIFSMYNPRPMLNEEEESLFNRAADILEEHSLLDEKGELIDEDEEPQKGHTMDTETALCLYNFLHPKSSLTPFQQNLFSQACDVLLENDLMEEDGTLVDKDKE